MATEGRAGADGKHITINEEDVEFIHKKPSHTGKRKSRKNSLTLLLGVIVTFTVCIFDTTGIACLQLIKELPPDIEINAVNYSVGFICVLVYFLVKRKLPRIKKDRTTWMFAICIVFLVDNLTLYNHEASFLPLGSIGSIGYAFNIIFSVILSKIFLTELITFHKGIALFVTLLGLVLTVLAHVPSLSTEVIHEATCSLNGQSTTDNSTVYIGPLRVMNVSGITSIKHDKLSNVTVVNNTKLEKCQNAPGNNKTFWSELLAMFLLAVSCFCSALETVVFSGSRLKHEAPTNIAFWIFASGCLVLVPSTFIFENPILPSTGLDLTYLFIYSVCAAGLSFLYIIAAQLLMPMFLTIIESFGVPLMFIVQMMFLIQISKPSNIWLQVAGVILVFISTVSLPVIEYITIRKNETSKDEENNLKADKAETKDSKL